MVELLPDVDRWRIWCGQVLRGEYTALEACQHVVRFSSAKFEEKVDIVMRLGVNPRRADQMVRGIAKLPHNTGKALRLCVFTDDAELAERVKGGPVVHAGGAKLVDAIASEPSNHHSPVYRCPA